jgi:hypothetical protein
MSDRRENILWLIRKKDLSRYASVMVSILQYKKEKHTPAKRKKK